MLDGRAKRQELWINNATFNNGIPFEVETHFGFPRK